MIHCGGSGHREGATKMNAWLLCQVSCSGTMLCVSEQAAHTHTHTHTSHAPLFTRTSLTSSHTHQIKASTRNAAAHALDCTNSEMLLHHHCTHTLLVIVRVISLWLAVPCRVPLYNRMPTCDENPGGPLRGATALVGPARSDGSRMPRPKRAGCPIVACRRAPRKVMTVEPQGRMPHDAP